MSSAGSEQKDIIFPENEYLRQQLEELKQQNLALSLENSRNQEKIAQLTTEVDLYSSLISNFPNYSIFLFDHDLRFLLADGPNLKKGNFTRQGIEGKTLYEVLPAANVAALEPYYFAALRGETAIGELGYGDEVDEVHALPIRNNSGEVVAGMLVSQNITKRKTLEIELKRRQEEFRALVENAPDIIDRYDRELRHVYINPAIEKITTFKVAEYIGKTNLELGLPEILGKIWQTATNRIFANGKEETLEFELPTPQGLRYFQSRLVPEKTANGAVETILAISRDVTPFKEAQSELAAEKEQLAVTLQSIGDGVITTDTEGRVKLINAHASRLTGWSVAEAIGQNLFEVMDLRNGKTNTPIEDLITQTLTTRQTLELPPDSILIGKNSPKILYIVGSFAPIHTVTSNKIEGVVIAFRDITEKQQLEQELYKAQKLESVGLLAGGIAHDFNNILTASVGYISLARLEASEHQPILSELLKEAEEAIFRARTLTQQLLTFSRGGIPVRKKVELHPILEEAVKFSLMGSNVNSRFVFSKDLHFVEIDSVQITQVIQNLVINAVQAMPSGGTITVKTENITVDHSTSNYSVPLKPETVYVAVGIGDEGVGIDPLVRNKIFDLYFTTKAKGTGLGLATCYSILTRHEGFITVDSAPDSGSVFTFYLPASPEPIFNEDIATTPPQIEAKGTLPPLKYSEHLLIIDDEEPILRLLYRLLSKRGYKVSVAPDGLTAITLYVDAYNSGDPPNLAIIDLTLPGGFGGKEIMEQLRKINPHVKALVSSGYSNDPVMAQFTDYGFAGAVSKPFKLNDLENKIREILDSI